MRRWHAVAGAFAVLSLVACTPAPRDGARPDAEFLLVSDDSTAWVRTSADTVIVHRAPLQVATLAGRLIEIYVAEDPIAFDRASFLVSRVFRRDLVTGDSTLVFADSIVLREAMAFVKAHPSAERLEDDEPVAEDAPSFEAGITPLDVVGGTVSLEVHLDHMSGERGTHDTYRATVDLESGRRLSLQEVITPRAAADAVVAARQGLGAAIVLASRRAGPVGKAASRAMASLNFDSLSFSLSRHGDSLAARFLAHDEQVIDENRDSHRYALEPVTVPAPAWWNAARPTLPRELADSSVRFELPKAPLEVVYDSQDVAAVRTRTASGPRAVTRMHGPLRRVIALGDSLIAPPGQWRRALERAFTESGYYSDQVRAASLRRRARPTASRQAAL